jgi:hypothetical protein
MKERGDSLYKLIRLMHSTENEEKNNTILNKSKNVSILDEVNRSKKYIKGNKKGESIMDNL